MSDTDSITQSPLLAYFTAYAASIPAFTYEPSISAHDNFYRLCKVSAWAKKPGELVEARKGFKDALVEEFNVIYGRNEHSLKPWQKLCKQVGTDPVPKTIGECKNVMQNTHVNIVDLIETANTEGTVTTFATLEELAEYTVETRRFFPKKYRGHGGVLEVLLRQILDAYKETHPGEGQKKKRRRRRRRGKRAGRTN